VRVLLVDDEYTREELNEPLGIEVLSTALSSTYGDRVEVRSLCCSLEPDDLDELIAGYSPHLVGLSTKVSSDRLLRTITSLPSVTQGAHSPLVVLGGMLPTLAAHEVLESFPDCLCVVGEGEEALIGLTGVLLELDGIGRRELVLECFDRAVPNLVFRSDAAIERTPRSVIQGSEEYLRPDRHFCSAILERQKVLNELAELSSIGAQVVYFTDEELIGTDCDRIRELCLGIIESKRDRRIDPHQHYFASISARSILGKDARSGMSGMGVLPDMRRAGFAGFFIGIESGSDSQLQRYHKGVTAEENAAVLGHLHNAGFETDIGFIMFDPEVTLRELRENLDFIRAAGLTTHPSRLGKALRLVPNTPLVEASASRGLISGPLDLKNLEYPWAFADQQVEAIHGTYSLWEQEVLPMAFPLQDTIRATALHKKQRDAAIERLVRLREIDVEFLSGCVAEAEKMVRHLDQRLHDLYCRFLGRLRIERRDT